MSGFKIGKLKFKDNGSTKIATTAPKKVKKIEKRQDEEDEDVVVEDKVINY